jgi:hypothetical protein
MGRRRADVGNLISVGDVELLRQVLWSVESNIGADVTEPERERGGLPKSREFENGKCLTKAKIDLE